jgi:hypothetical protein
MFIDYFDQFMNILFIEYSNIEKYITWFIRTSDIS